MVHCGVFSSHLCGAWRTFSCFCNSWLSATCIVCLKHIVLLLDQRNLRNMYARLLRDLHPLYYMLYAVFSLAKIQANRAIHPPELVEESVTTYYYCCRCLVVVLSTFFFSRPTDHQMDGFSLRKPRHVLRYMTFFLSRALVYITCSYCTKSGPPATTTTKA